MVVFEVISKLGKQIKLTRGSVGPHKVKAPRTGRPP